MAASAPVPDMIAIKEMQRRAWSAGDYRPLGARMLPAAESLCERAGVSGGLRVLDVATGTGNAALAAARRGCDVVGVDFVPGQLEVARARAAAEGLEVRFLESDAEALPVPDASFDAVVSVFGAIFAPDQERAAAELLRACRPGGTIAMANWTLDLAAFFGIVAAYAPPPPELESPLRWGTPEGIGELLGDGVSTLEHATRTIVEHYESPDAFADFYCTRFGPIVAVLETLEDDARAALRADLRALGETHRSGGGVAAEFEYLEVVAQRSPKSTDSR
jgi:ubiquinone/menaquinone biosynthesis C-methylase UbiE